MGTEISNSHAMMMLLAKASAEQRFAGFLLSLSMRHQRCGLSPVEFSLSMSRYDIANFLGLAPETVSRMFARFEEFGLIFSERRRVCLRDISRLSTLVDGVKVLYDR